MKEETRISQEDMWVRRPGVESAVRVMFQVKFAGHWALVVLFTLLLLDAPCCDASVLRQSRHHNFRGRNHRHRHRPFKMPSIVESGLPIPVSYHLVLSESKPTEPPWELLQNNSEPSSDRTEFSHDRHQRHRSKRSTLPFESVCEGRGEWVALTRSEDIYGYEVEVLQNIEIGGVRMDQYFYETHCIQDESSCRGVDSNQFESKCKNKYIWTYGYVRKSSGEDGWCQIKIRGSCNCAIRRRRNGSETSVTLLDFL